MPVAIRILSVAGIFLSAIGVLSSAVDAQKVPARSDTQATRPAVKITKIDIDGLRTVLKPNNRPLLVNFWATWCDPCREEFPDLVHVDEKYRGKIDFVTISLDDPADIDGLVPKFLSEMNAVMPAFLLAAKDETAAIKLVSSDWAGSLPLTMLYDASGGVALERKGKVSIVKLSEHIDRLLLPAPAS